MKLRSGDRNSSRDRAWCTGMATSDALMNSITNGVGDVNIQYTWCFFNTPYGGLDPVSGEQREQRDDIGEKIPLSQKWVLNTPL